MPPNNPRHDNDNVTVTRVFDANNANINTASSNV